MPLWRFTGIYGIAARGGRNHTWNLIRSLAASVSNLPWLMAGDFNEIMWRKDKSGGNERALAAMLKFRKAMIDADLSDMGFVGSKYIWYGPYTKERLDRGFQSQTWKLQFRCSRVITLPLSKSDHCPLLIEILKERIQRSKSQKLFCFDQNWYGRDDCLEIIQQEWATPLTCNALAQLGSKCKAIGAKLDSWNHTDFNRLQTEMRKTQDQVQVLMAQPFSPNNYAEQKFLHSHYSQLLSQEEKYWIQRSRATWLKEGDRNSAYFHRKGSNRKSKNTIKGLNDEQGTWQVTPEEIHRLLLSYFQQIFTAESVERDAINTVMEAIPVKVATDV